MNNNKQSIIGFVLISLVFLAYVLYNNYQQTKFQEQQMVEQAEQLAEQAEQPVETSAEVAPQPSEQPSEQAASQPVGEQVVFDAPSQEEVVVENDVMQIRFSTLGAQVVDVTLKDYTKYAPKEERTELVKLFAPESAHFDMSFYLKHNMRNVKVETAAHNFELVGVETLEQAKRVTMRLAMAEGASLDFIYTIYNEQRPERDYMVDFDVHMNGMSPLMANQTSIGID